MLERILNIIDSVNPAAIITTSVENNNEAYHQFIRKEVSSKEFRKSVLKNTAIGLAAGGSFFLMTYLIYNAVKYLAE